MKYRVPRNELEVFKNLVDHNYETFKFYEIDYADLDDKDKDWIAKQFIGTIPIIPYIGNVRNIPIDIGFRIIDLVRNIFSMSILIKYEFNSLKGIINYPDWKDKDKISIIKKVLQVEPLALTLIEPAEANISDEEFEKIREDHLNNYSGDYADILRLVYGCKNINNIFDPKRINDLESYKKMWYLEYLQYFGLLDDQLQIDLLNLNIMNARVIPNVDNQNIIDFIRANGALDLVYYKLNDDNKRKYFMDVYPFNIRKSLTIMPNASECEGVDFETIGRDLINIYRSYSYNDMSDDVLIHYIK